MDFSKSILIGRLAVRQQPHSLSSATPRRRFHRCMKAKHRPSRAAMITSFAYLNLASNSSLHPVQKHFAYITSRWQSSKGQTGSGSCVKKESGTSWSMVYHAAEAATSSLHRKVMSGLFSPLLTYSSQVFPKLSTRDHMVMSQKQTSQEQTDSCSSSKKENTVDRTQPSRENINEARLPQRIATPTQREEHMTGRDSRVEFRSTVRDKKSVSLWVQMPSLKKYASVSGLRDIGLSATRVLHRRKKFENAAASTETIEENVVDKLEGIDHVADSSVKESEPHPTSISENFSESSVAYKELECSNKSTSSGYATAAEFMKRVPSTTAHSIFKRLGVTSFTSPSTTYMKPNATPKPPISDSSGFPREEEEHRLSLKTARFVNSESIVTPVKDDGQPRGDPGKASYIYNNYNFKYIQVNLFRTPSSMFQLKRKEKPILQPQHRPLEDDGMAFFDADVPLLDMTEAMNNKDASGVANDSTEGSTQTAVADRSKRYAAVAGKVTEEKSKAAEEKSARKPVKTVISKANIDARTKSLAVGIIMATSNASRLLKLERLCNHLVQYPESRHIAIQERLIPALLKLKQRSKDSTLLAHTHQMLAQLGYAPAVQGRGVRILAVDGGGSRGIIPIEVLRELERQAGQPIHQMFDYIIGVSSGAVLVYLLAYAKTSLDVCEQLFKEQSVEVFNRNSLLGTSKLFFSHAYYDTDAWMKILRSHMHGVGQTSAIEMSQDPACPKVAAVATLMNAGAIKNFLFRNYNPPPNTTSFYQGSSKHQLSEGLRASSAAPGYFEEYKLDDYVFQDGGVLTNNPSALGLHESKLLWPDTPIQCVVSLGTGRYDPVEEGLESAQYSSLKKKLYQIMISATDTESVHTTLQDLLPSGSYFRFNPLITEDFLLDENRPDKIDQLQQEALDFVSINELKIMQAAGVLTREKSSLQRAQDWVKEKRDMY